MDGIRPVESGSRPQANEEPKNKHQEKESREPPKVERRERSESGGKKEIAEA